MIIKAPQPLSGIGNRFSVFLAGSIEMDKAERWQEKLEQALGAAENICILNPRRDSWNSDWKQETADPQFYGQVSWELEAMEKADLVLFYFASGTSSPVSMLELGLYARSGKALVCCPEGFWRKGNIDIVCERYQVKQAKSLEEMINYINTIITTPS